VSPDLVIDMAQDSVWTLLLAAAPMLVAGMVVGLLISIVQAATQVNEMTMTFVPKIVAVMVTAVLFLPFIMSELTTFTREIFARIVAVGLS
jgi:flagellar biosynthetic protein FliQ